MMCIYKRVYWETFTTGSHEYEYEMLPSLISLHVSAVQEF